MGTLAVVQSIPLACGLLGVAGLAGMANMSSLNIAGQSVLADWVRGRGLAIVQLTFMLALAAGGALWGTLAANIGVGATLRTAAACLAASTLLGWRFRLAAATTVDPALAHQTEPYVPVTLSPDDGPILLSVEYRIDADSLPEFLTVAQTLGRMRRREGAMRWTLYADPNDAQRHVEMFIAPSWSEHMRSANRLTRTDAEILARARSFHRGDREPELTALLAHKDVGAKRQHQAPPTPSRRSSPVPPALDD